MSSWSKAGTVLVVLGGLLCLPLFCGLLNGVEKAGSIGAFLAEGGNALYGLSCASTVVILFAIGAALFAVGKRRRRP